MIASNTARSRGGLLPVLHALVCGTALVLALLGQLARWLPLLDVLNSAMPFVAAIASVCFCVGLAQRRYLPRLWHVVAILAVVLAAERIGGEMVRPIASASADTGRDVRILTFNAFHSNSDPALAVRAILAEHPDIVLLQEAPRILKLHDAAFERAFPYRSGCPHGCDPAIVSRWPLEPLRYRFRDARGKPDGVPLLQAIVHPDDGRPPFAVASIHLPRPTEDAAMVRNQHLLLARTTARYGSPRLVLSGDFNLTPWSFALQSLDDALRPMTRSTRAVPTYPGNAIVPPLLPIDQMYVGPLWLVRSVRQMPYAGSDHRGLLVTLQPIEPIPLRQ